MYYQNVNKEVFEMWAMKDDGVKKNWEKEYSIVPTRGNFGSLLSPLCFLKNGRILFQNGMGRMACYDKERKRLTYVKKIDKGFQIVKT